MAVLYRKYRPQTFSEVVNQKHIIQTLKNQVAMGQVSHAYLFTGGRGIGKTSVARIMAKAVNCLQRAKGEGLSAKEGDACGKCDNCKAIENGNFLDLVEIDAASNTGVENVRELIEHVKFAPSSGKYKVFIIDEVHMLSKQAFNALLKTLEEPPKHTIFILATTEINKVLPTIISRTQRFDFKALTTAEIFEHLKHIAREEKLNFNPEILELVANNAEGSARDALSLLDKLATLGDNLSLEDSQQLLGITDMATCEKLLQYIAEGKISDLPEFFGRLMEKGLDFTVLNRDFLEYLRKILVHKITQGAQGFGLSAEHLETLKELGAKLSLQDAMFIIRLFLRSFKELDSSPSQELPLLLASLEAAQKKGIGLRAKGQVVIADAEKAPRTESAAVKPAPILSSVNIEQTTEQPASLPAEETTSAEVVSLQEAQSFWPKIVSEVKKINSPLANLLKSCALTSVDGNKIIVSVKYLFNKQHLENAKNVETISRTLKEVSGKNLALLAEVQKPQSPQTDTVAALSDALKVFGGELIE